MTIKVNAKIGASSACAGWNAIDWQTAKRQVRRLQMRIAKAVREGRHNKVKALQWILTHSFYAKTLAVKRVVQNTGGKTAGVDNVLWKSSKQKMQAVKSLRRRGYSAQPLRRVYIPKKACNYPQLFAKLNPNSISINLDKPLHITVLPGGGSELRAK